MYDADYVTTGDVVYALIRAAKQYKKDDPMKSIERNRHMNAFRPREDGSLPEIPKTDERVIDAVIVDLINYFASQYGIDLAMYAEDIKSPIREDWEKKLTMQEKIVGPRNPKK